MSVANVGQKPWRNDNIFHFDTLPARAGEIWPKSVSELHDRHRDKQSIEVSRLSSHKVALLEGGPWIALLPIECIPAIRQKSGAKTIIRCFVGGCGKFSGTPFLPVVFPINGQTDYVQTGIGESTGC